MLKDYIEDNIILIIPNNIKIDVLEEICSLNKILNIKIMSLEELSNLVTFSYDERSIYYLIKKYNMNYDVAKMYLKNIKYVDNKKYDSDKLNKLTKIKNELEENNLLIHDYNILNYLNNKKIIIYGYDYINEYYIKILDYIKKKVSATVNIVNKPLNNYEHEIYEFNKIDDEVEFVATKICELIQHNVNINNIKLCSVTNEYINVIIRIFSLFNIPINLNEKKSIISSNIVQDFLKKISISDVCESLDYINNKYNMNNLNNLYIYDEIVKIINKYNFVKEKDILIYILKNELKYTYNKSNKLKNAISIVDIKNNNIKDDDYVFLVGFNMGNIPHIYKDEEYITDNIKDDIEKEKTDKKNKIEKKIIINNIKGIKNLVITYKLKTSFDNYLPSNLIEDLNYKVIKNVNISHDYSNIFNCLKLSIMLDNLIKYGLKGNDVDLLYSNYKNISYLKYNNKFKGIDKVKFNNSLNGKLTLSYSSIDNYNRCAFRYYLNNILKITDFEESFAQMIGSMFHDILSKAFIKGFDFDVEFNSYIEDKILSNKDKFFLEKLKEELKFIINTIKKQNTFSKLDKALYENKVYINKEGNIKLTFMGIIDKILCKEEDGKTYLVIIDYKTGNLHTNINNVFYGIDMQLPVYLYLSKKGLFNNAQVIGFYLQKILNKEINRQKGKTYVSQKEDNLKLQGYTIDNEEMVSMFDYTYKDSEVIKSLKFGKTGFYAYSKIITEEQIDKLIDIVEDNIDKSFNNILDAKFDINPKKIGKNNVGCEFCKYKDICYMSQEDIVNLEEKKFI